MVCSRRRGTPSRREHRSHVRRPPPFVRVSLTEVAFIASYYCLDGVSKHYGSTLLSMTSDIVDAKLAHVTKFSAAYLGIYPYSSQVLIESTSFIYVLPNFILVRRLSRFQPRTQPLQRRRLQAASNLLHSLGVTSNPPASHRVLTHVLSNGTFIPGNS